MDCTARNAFSEVLGLTIPAFQKGASDRQKKDALLRAYWAVVGPAILKKAKGKDAKPTIFDAGIRNAVEKGAAEIELYGAKKPAAVRRILLQFIVDEQKDTALLSKTVPMAKLVVALSGKKQLLTAKEMASAIIAAIDGLNKTTKARKLAVQMQGLYLE